MRDWHTEQMHKMRRDEANKPLLRNPCFICNVIKRYDQVNIIEDSDNIIIYREPVSKDDIHYVFALRGHTDFRTAMKSGHLGNLLSKVADYVKKLDLLSYKVLIDASTQSYTTEEHANVQLIGHKV